MSRLFVSFILVASALAAAAPPASAASLLVCADGCPYADIPSAIAAASNGDTIVVQPGTYSGAITINKALTLCSTVASGTACSPNANEVTIDGAGAIYPVFITADDVVLQGFTIQNPTFTPTGFVDPSLVVVFGVDNADIASNILQLPATPLAPTQSRWHTTGVNVALDGVGEESDDVRIFNNIFRHFTESIGPDGTCTTGTCRTEAINLWGAGAAPEVSYNNMLLPPGSASATGIVTIGIAGNAANALIEGNVIQPTGDVIGSFYGIKGSYTSSVFDGNSFYGSLHGLFVSGADITIEDNYFQQNNEGLRITARDSTISGNTFEANSVGIKVAAPNGAPEATDLLVRENLFGTNTQDISIHSQITGYAFDLRENDWGTYSADQIALFIEDESGANTIDFSCFIAEDGVTRVCPDASFTVNVGSSWPRIVTLTDTSTFPGSELGEREWTLPSGTSDDAVVTLSLNPGSYTFDLRVVDGEGFEDTATSSLLLSNTAPTFSLAGPYAASEGALFSLPLGATDAESDTLTYTILAGPAGMTISGGNLRWTPGYATAGSYPFTVRVSDGNLAVASSSSVVVSDVPVGATIGAIANVNVNELASASRSVTATSPSGSSITLSATGLPPGASFSSTGGSGSFAITAPSGSAGVYAVTIEAVSEGLTTTKTFNVVITMAVGLNLERISPTVVQASPGQVVALSARITNLGSASDTMTLSMTSSRAWPIALPANPVLASGASVLVDALVTIPAGADAGFFTLKACSTTSPAICKSILYRIEVPLVLTLDMEDAFSMLGEINGTAHVKYLNGAPASGISMTFTERHQQNLFVLTSSVSGTTDATGAFAFVAGDARASLFGTHAVSIVADHGDLDATLADSYDVGV